MIKWNWIKTIDAENHPYWSANGMTIWLSGGNSGDYLTDFGTRHKSLNEAKRICKDYYENG